MISTGVLAKREVLRLSGRDAMSFLNGQVSQNVASILEGTGAASFLLQPDGKVVDLIGLHAHGEAILIDVDLDAVEHVEQRLRRFMFRVDVAIERSQMLVCWWPQGTAPDGCLSSRPFGRSGVLTIHEVLPDGVEWLSDERARAERIAQEIPAFGSEITDRTIPAALGTGLVASAVSFTKGCYTGQELVARLDARGSQVPFHLVALSAKHELFVGDALLLGEQGPKGEVTSIALSEDGETFIGLGFAHRSQVDAVTLHSPRGEDVSVRVLDGSGVFSR